MNIETARAKIAQRKATMGRLRGRSLTADEQLNNLFAALGEHDSDCAVHQNCGCDCGANEFARKFPVG